MTTDHLPSSIKAIIQPDWQSTKLELTELPLPKLKPNSKEHLIKVFATSPTAGELLWVKDFPAILTDQKTLGVPCYDLAGVVVTAPPESSFHPGTEVYTRTAATRDGNAREYTIATAEELAVKPKSLTWAEAASVPLSALTAYQALFDHGGLEPAFEDGEGKARNSKKRILITGASGGVGVWVVQLAKAAGVGSIVGVCGPNNVDFVKSLGATDIINYRAQTIDDFFSAGHDKVDMALDVIGGESLDGAWRAVKRGGILLSIKSLPEKAPDGTEADVRTKFFIMEPLGWQLNTVTRLLDRGMSKPVVDSIFSFNEYRKAFDTVAGGHSRGKVIIKVFDN